MGSSAERAVLDLLADGPMEVAQLLARAGVDPAVLRKLQDQGLVATRSSNGRHLLALAQRSTWASHLGKVMRTPGSSC